MTRAAFHERLLVATELLGSLVRGGFGPTPAAKTLLFAPPDPPVVTADGHTLLAQWLRGLRESRSQTESVQTLALVAADALHLRAGDGASEFMLLLQSTVERTLAGSAAPPWRVLATAFGDLRREIERLLLAERSMHGNSGLCVLVPITFEHSGGGLVMTPSSQLHESIAAVLRSGLAGDLSDRVLEFFVQLVMAWLFTPLVLATEHEDAESVDAQLLFKRASRFLARAADRILFAQSLSVFDSHVVPPDEFILRKAQLPSHTLSDDAAVHFVCLTCELSLAAGVNHVTMQTDSTAELFAVADAMRAFVIAFVTKLRRTHDVTLLVCTEQVDDRVAAICTRLGIACVQFAESVDVSDLCAAAGVYALASLFDEIRGDDHVGVSSCGVANAWLQSRPNLRFRGLKKPARQQSVAVVPQLLLKAPTTAAYAQYRRAVVKALRILRGWWETSDPDAAISSSSKQRRRELYCCRGGGATELAIARYLDDASSPTTSTEASRLVRQSFADALRDVAAVLKSNLAASMGGAPVRGNADSERSSTSIASKRSLLQDMTRMSLEGAADSDASDRRCPLHGYVLDTSRTIETVGGPVSVPELVFDDPEAYGLLHPWQRIDSLLQAVLHTLEQFFRIDCELHTQHKDDGDDSTA